MGTLIVDTARFDDDTLSYRRGSTLCGSASFEDGDGNPTAMLWICTAPEIAWVVGETEPWDTCIFFSNRAGAKSASRVARWLLRSDPRAPLLIEGSIILHVGEKHAALPCWRRLVEAAPALFPWRQEVKAFIAWFEGRSDFTPDDWALLLLAVCHCLPPFSEGGV